MDLILLLVLALATYRLSNMLADVDQHEHRSEQQRTQVPTEADLT